LPYEKEMQLGIKEGRTDNNKACRIILPASSPDAQNFFAGTEIEPSNKPGLIAALSGGNEKIGAEIKGFESLLNIIRK
jgi:hypothetical protein